MADDPNRVSDRNLLFGILAMQMDFITSEQLVVAMQAWVFDKSKPLGDILIAQKVLATDECQLIEELVKKHLAHHGRDAEKSLAALDSAPDVKADLKDLADPDVQASLARVHATTKDADPAATIPSPDHAPTGGMRFRVVRHHAKGGLGEVFIAHDNELNREVALKEIQRRHANNLGSRARFLIEAEITGALEHPGIVSVYSLSSYPDGRPYYVMRFIQGESLKDAVSCYHKEAHTLPAGERELNLRGLLRRLIDVCNAMAYAHSRGVLHRDLKPGNIMLGKYGETLVIDWGLAKALGAFVTASSNVPSECPLEPKRSKDVETRAGETIGTPQYMSPEQAEGKLELMGPASDIYSLGATLYTILTGHLPIQGSDIGVIVNKVQRGDFRKPREVSHHVPRALEAICLKAMAIKPQDRYGSARALATDIERWLADEPVSADREPFYSRTRRWIGRHPRTVGVAVTCFLLLPIWIYAYQRQEIKNLQRQQFTLHSVVAERAFLSGDYSDAVVSYQRALEIDQNCLEAWHKQGVCLSLLGDWNAAARAFEQTLRIDPMHPNCSWHLGVIRMELEDYVGAISAFEKAEAASNDSVQMELKLAKLAQRKPAILSGGAATFAELVSLAGLSQNRKRYAEATTFYVRAFSMLPGTIEMMFDSQFPSYRIDAARSASLASAGKGRDAQAPNEDEAGRLRRLAFTWLKADLALRLAMLENNPTKLHDDLEYWQGDYAFDVLRDEEELAKLLPEEQAELRKFWAEVAHGREIARSKYSEIKYQGELLKERLNKHQIYVRAGAKYVIELESRPLINLAEKSIRMSLENKQGKQVPNTGKTRIDFSSELSGSYYILAAKIQDAYSATYVLRVREVPGGK